MVFFSFLILLLGFGCDEIQSNREDWGERLGGDSSWKKSVLRFVWILSIGLGNIVTKFIFGDNDLGGNGDCWDE